MNIFGKGVETERKTNKQEQLAKQLNIEDFLRIRHIEIGMSENASCVIIHGSIMEPDNLAELAARLSPNFNLSFSTTGANSHEFWLLGGRKGAEKVR